MCFFICPGPFILTVSKNLKLHHRKTEVGALGFKFVRAAIRVVVRETPSMLNKYEKLMLHQTGEKKRFKQTKFQPDLVPSHTLHLVKATGIT